MEINDVLKTNNECCPNSLNVLYEFVVIILMGLLFILGAQIPKEDKVGNMHVIRFGFIIYHCNVMIIRQILITM
jgi:hypothetical protein